MGIIENSKLKIQNSKFSARYLKFLFPVFCFIFCVLSFGSVCSAKTVKRPNVAGSFYPADKEELGVLIKNFLGEAAAAPGAQESMVLVSPHAGYVYSGPVAAYGYSLLAGKDFKTVIVLGASHYFGFRGAAVYPEGVFKTPLGDLEVDSGFVSSLIKIGSGLVAAEPKYFEEEHSLEVQLPFLQETLKAGFKIVPVIIGEMSYEECEALARHLASLAAETSILVIASSDLSHYKTYEEARRIDAATLAYLRDLDAKGLWDVVAQTGWNVCGAKAVVTALLFAKLRGAERAEILKYANSGDTAGGKDKVVGYVSAVVWRPPQQSPDVSMSAGKKTSDEGEKMLTKEERRRLLEIARMTLEAHVNGKKVPVFDEKNPALAAHQGAFVTLREGGELRGCIGNLVSTEPLVQLVSKMAIEASTHDWRFSPVVPEELKEIAIEISVLSVPQLIDDWRKVRLGTDGVVLRRGSSSGVFLPQVATETGWDLEIFLSQLCSQKAGLPSDCYKSSETKLYTFQAEVFSEKE